MEIEIGARIGKVKAIINEEVIENDIKVEIEKIGEGVLNLSTQRYNFEDEKYELGINNIIIEEKEAKRKLFDLQEEFKIITSEERKEYEEKNAIAGFNLTKEQKTEIEDRFNEIFVQKFRETKEKIKNILEETKKINIREFSTGYGKYYQVFIQQKLTKFEEQVLQFLCFENNENKKVIRDIEISEFAKKTEDNSGDYNIDYFYENVDYKKLICEVEKQKKIKQIEKDKKTKERENKFLEAKQTGQKVILYRYSDDCNETDLDCDVDNIFVYAMPDGSEKEERIHTY